MTDNAHARPPGRHAEPLFDPGLPALSHAERARTLVASISTGTLCTLAREPAGHPYGSLVTFGLDAERPVFLISTLAEHTKNLQADGRASLLVAESHSSDPLANGRVTLVGEAVVEAAARRERARAAFLERFPDATHYDGFQDFSFWSLVVASARYIGGYGRMSWVSGAEWAAAQPDPIAPHAADILEHMNQDHADALPLYCQAFSRAGQVPSATMTGIDRYGFEMSVPTAEGPRPVRVAFPEPITSKADARKVLVALLQKARAQLANSSGARG
jgi:putative heme iron utilization protein